MTRRAEHEMATNKKKKKKKNKHYIKESTTSGEYMWVQNTDRKPVMLLFKRTAGRKRGFRVIKVLLIDYKVCAEIKCLNK